MYAKWNLHYSSNILTTKINRPSVIRYFFFVEDCIWTRYQNWKCNIYLTRKPFQVINSFWGKTCVSLGRIYWVSAKPIMIHPLSAFFWNYDHPRSTGILVVRAGHAGAVTLPMSLPLWSSRVSTPYEWTWVIFSLPSTKKHSWSCVYPFILNPLRNTMHKRASIFRINPAYVPLIYDVLRIIYNTKTVQNTFHLWISQRWI